MNNQHNNIVLSTSSIRGTTVKNATDEKIGKIEDIMMDTRTGEVAYVVLSVDSGFLNLGSKYFAIPFQSMSFTNHQDDVIIFDVDKDRLENSPGFDKDNWPTGPQTEFISEVNTYYGIESHRSGEGRIGELHNDTIRDNYDDRRNPSTKESDFLG